MVSLPYESQFETAADKELRLKVWLMIKKRCKQHTSLSNQRCHGSAVQLLRQADPEQETGGSTPEICGSCCSLHGVLHSAFSI